MNTAGRRSNQSRDSTRHMRRDEGCWSARASTVVALVHSLFARSAPRRFDVSLFPSEVTAGSARNMLPNLDDSTGAANIDGSGSFSLVRGGA